MHYSPLIEKALQKAIELHAGQTRKHDGTTPFIVHPIGVALFLAEYTDDPHVISAALLHDTLEDTAYTKKELEKDFGKKIADLVVELTEPPRATTPWKQRKEYYIHHLKTASRQAHMISIADKINNLASMIDAYSQQGEALWSKFNSDTSLWYYHEIFKVVSSDKELKPLVDIYGKILEEAHRTFGS